MCPLRAGRRKVGRWLAGDGVVGVCPGGGGGGAVVVCCRGGREWRFRRTRARVSWELFFFKLNEDAILAGNVSLAIPISCV